MKKINALLIASLIGSVAAFGATKFDATTDGSDAELVFGVARGNQSVTAISATSDAAGKLLKVYTRDNAGWYSATEARDAAATSIGISNTGNLLTTNDIIVIQYSDGSAEKNVVSANTATSITVTAISAALTTSDKIFEMSQVYQATVGTTTVTPEGNPIVDVPVDSPVFISLSAATNANVSATVK